MDLGFFDEQGDTVVQNQQSSSSKQYQQAPIQGNTNNADDEFDFAEQVQSATANSQNISSYQQEQISRRIREEQESIQSRLREKANQEYEEKQKRKQRGKQQLEQYLQKKEQEKTQRKEENIENEKITREQTKKLNEEAGWIKVGANVALKQGEHPGTKDINRMREAMINKRSDQSQ